MSSVYGTNAFFGIVNIVTRGATETPRAWGRVGGSSFGTSAAAGFAMGDVDHQLRGSVAAYGRWGEPLTVPELGTVDQDRARALSASLVGAYEGAFVQARFYRRERTLAFAPYTTVIDDPHTEAADTLGMLEGGYTRELSPRLNATVRGYANAYRYRDRLLLEDGSGTFTDTGDSRWFGAEARGRYAVLAGDRLGVTAGAEVTFISTESRAFYYQTPDDVIEIDKPFNIQGLYAEIDGRVLPWLAYTAGVRADRNSIHDDRVSPRAAVFASRDTIGAKLLYAEGFRNPSAYEGYFEDGIQFLANPDIRAETIRSFELVGWARPRPGLTTRVSAFRWTDDRLIEQEPVMTPDGDLLQFQNLGSLRSTGVEVEASFRDARGWLAFGGVSIQRVEDGAGHRAVGAPAWLGSAGVSSPLVAGRFHLSTEVQAIGGRTTRVASVAVDPFVAWNAAIYAPALAAGLDLTVGARNLLGIREQVPAPEDFDRIYDDHTTYVPRLPGEGRELYAQLGYRY